MADETEPNVASLRAILESLTPTELALEYTRAVGEPPPEGLASGRIVELILAKLNGDSDGKPRLT